MTRSLFSLAAAGLAAFVCATASAQAVRVEYPLSQIYYSPVVVHRPVVTYYSPAPQVVSSYSPVVQYGTPVTTYYAPGSVPATQAAPVVTYYAPYAPVVTAYRPVYGANHGAVIVRPKVYVRGQPIRNAFRAITP